MGKWAEQWEAELNENKLLSCYTGLDSLCAPFLALSFNNEGTCNHDISCDNGAVIL